MHDDVERRSFLLGSLMGGLAVALGAFGAHALEHLVEDPALLDTWDVASRYHFFHAFAVLAVAALPRRPRRAGQLFLAGTAVFSGSLYLLVLTGARWLGAITPVGGVLLIAGWISLLWSSHAEGSPPTPPRP